MRYWLVLLGSLLLSRGTQAQMCGGGAFICRVDRPAGPLAYELTALKPVGADSLLRVVHASAPAAPVEEYNRLLLQLYGAGLVLNAEGVARLRAAHLLQPEQPLWMRTGLAANERRLVRRAGPVPQGELAFNTDEGSWVPCLLKLTDGKSVFYLLCNPLGACTRWVHVQWGDSPAVVDNRD